MEIMAWIISPFKPKVKAFVKGRRDALTYLANSLSTNQSKLLWVHASSVGEYEQGRPLMDLFKEQYPDYKILVSFYSPSGYEAVQIDKVVDYKCYLPLDTRSNAKKFIELAKPNLALFIKYEFWHFYLDELSKSRVPLYSVSSIFRASQPFFKWYGSFFRNMLKKFDYFFVQDHPSEELLKSIGLESTVSGDTRIDRVLAIRNASVSLPQIEAFSNEGPTFIIGSMRKEDLDFVIDFIRLTPDTKFIVAPHEITEEMMTPLENEFDCARYTRLTEETFLGKVLLLDTIGILSKVYRFGQFAYVGGGFSDGIHNILEPAVYRLPVFFGNLDYTRFKEAMDLTSLGVAFAVGSANEMAEVHQDIINNPARTRQIEDGIDSYLKVNKGASEKIMAYLNQYIA